MLCVMSIYRNEVPQFLAIFETSTDYLMIKSEEGAQTYESPTATHFICMLIVDKV